MTHLPSEPFDALYRADADPWSFATAWYEQRRYDLTLAALPRPRYERCFEPGCSIGELTRRLATRCDAVEAIDFSPTAAAEGRRRCAPLGHVDISVGELPDDWPAGRFDLIVFSEIGYYFTLDGLADLHRRVVDSLAPQGTFLAVHWRGTSDTHLLSGDSVHEQLRAAPGLTVRGHYEDPGFLLDLWEAT